MELITVQDLSKLMKVAQSTVYLWVTTGFIPCYRLQSTIRFDRQEIETWVKTKREDSQKLRKRPQDITNSLHKEEVNDIINNAIAAGRTVRYNSDIGKSDQSCPGRRL